MIRTLRILLEKQEQASLPYFLSSIWPLVRRPQTWPWQVALFSAISYQKVDLKQHWALCFSSPPHSLCVCILPLYLILWLSVNASIVGEIWMRQILLILLLVMLYYSLTNFTLNGIIYRYKESIISYDFKLFQNYLKNWSFNQKQWAGLLKEKRRQFSIFNQVRHHIKIGFNEILLFLTLLSEYWISCNIAQI